MKEATAVPELNHILHELVTKVRAILGSNFIGAYLQGSFAMGDWDSHSDVDFLIAIQEDVDEITLEKLQAMHGRIYNLPSPWVKHLEGSYFPQAILRQQDVANTPLWYLDNTHKELERSIHDNTLVVRWVAREYGIPLVGPSPKNLIDPVPADALRQEVAATMQEWGEEILTQQYKIENRWAQPFAVISYCRMLQTMQTGRITSKPAGAQWAMENVDGRFHNLIQRAWADRPYPSQKVRLPAPRADITLTHDFIHYALALISERWLDGKSV